MESVVDSNVDALEAEEMISLVLTLMSLFIDYNELGAKQILECGFFSSQFHMCQFVF